MFRLADWPIRRKLGFLTGVGVLTVLLLACTAFTIHDVQVIRQDKVEEITTLADILGYNATAALEFHDPKTAKEVLSSLYLQPSVEIAALYDAQGKLFALYSPKPYDEKALQVCPEPTEALFTEDGYLSIAEGIYRDGDKVGTVYIRSNLSEIGRELVSVFWIVIVAMTVSLAVAMLITWRLQRLFTTPIQQLVKAMKNISAGGDFSQHVKKLGNDEMGILCDGFNTMIDQIKTTSDELQHAHDVLEERVVERTEELQAEVIERKKAENEIRQSEARFRDVAMSMSDWVWECDAKGHYTYCSDNVLDLLGYSAEEMLGRTPFELMSVDEAVRIKKIFNEVVANKDPIRDLENRNIAKDGREIILSTNSVPILDEEGNLVGYRGVDKDITERKLAELELAKAKDAAEAANQAKSEFLANMSHEIRTPMTAILGFSDILMGSELDREQLDAATTIKQNGDHLIGIINDILDLSKIEAGKMEVEHVECSPCQVLSEVVSLMRVRATAKNLSLDVEYDGLIPQTIQSDPTRLRQILINLTGNAIKFTEVGDVRLIARLLDADSDMPKMQFKVVDSGIGMTDDQMARLFKPFQQADTSTTGKFGGTGLGLTISKRLAEKLGGDISIESTIGSGSTFVVTIETGSLDGVKMLDNPSEAQITIEPERKPEVPKSKIDSRVLLAEDGPDNQRLIAFLLKKAGAEVIVAENGHIAYDLAMDANGKGSPFDVILMDMQMPVMDGYQATGKLREAGYTGPIIALTAHAMSTDRDKCLDAGCDDYMTKPIERKKLVSMVAEYSSSQEFYQAGDAPVA